ncbi:RNA polymerase sigma factor [Methylorubrum extorquens]
MRPPAGAECGSLDQLLRRYYGELNALAAAKLRNRDAAADLVQDAVVRFLLANREREQGGGQGSAPLVSPRQFLRAIVSNLAVDASRLARRHGVVAPLDEVLHVADPAPLADRVVAARQEYEAVRAALNEMPARWRQALLLNRLEDWSHTRIARHFGVSPTMVAKYILSALRRCFIARSGSR